MIKFIMSLFRKKKMDVPKDGIVAFLEGFKFEENPFESNTVDWLRWRCEWLYESGWRPKK